MDEKQIIEVLEPEYKKQYSIPTSSKSLISRILGGWSQLGHWPHNMLLDGSLVMARPNFDAQSVAHILVNDLLGALYEAILDH